MNNMSITCSKITIIKDLWSVGERAIRIINLKIAAAILRENVSGVTLLDVQGVMLESLLKRLFFEDFRTDSRLILRAMLRIAGRQSQHSICTTLGITQPTFTKFVKKITIRMQIKNDRMKKLGRPGTLV
ncbi:hypothetical protein COBT_001865 [Conglomerata obtusa]